MFLPQQQEGHTPPVKETLMKLGFTYFFILQRFYDIDPKLTHEGWLQTWLNNLNSLVFKYNCIKLIFCYFLSDLHITPDQEAAFRYYNKNSMSIEVLKDDILQKVNFRVTNKVRHFYK